MKRRDLLQSAALSGLCLTGFPLGFSLAQENTAVGKNKKRVLFFTRNVGFEHSVVHRSGDKLSFAEQQMTTLLNGVGIDVVCEKDGRVFDGDIDQYDAFLLYCNNDLTAKNKRKVPPMTKTGFDRMMKAIATGTGFMGFHSTSACWRTPGEKNQNQLDKLSPFLKMLGGEFIAHGAQQEALQHVVSPEFPGTKELGKIFRLHEEFYGLKNFAKDLHIILTQETKGMKGQWYQRPPYPSTWARKHGQGRVFYTALGHREDVWENELFKQIVLGGLSWILKYVDADVTPNIEKVTPQAYALSNEASHQEEELSWKRDDATLTLMRGDQVVWRFNFGFKHEKPFFGPVNLPGMGDLTWNAPPDHPWHHGLWFSWKLINGVNYWEENRQTGKSGGRTSWEVTAIEQGKDFSARIELELTYHPPGQPPVLTEHRVIEVSAPDSGGGYQIDWTAKFTAKGEAVVLDRTPLPDEPNGKIYGGYAGLSVRLSEAASQFEVVDSDGLAKEMRQGGQQKTRTRFKARAVDYAGSIQGKSGGIAILDHPDNLNAPSPWYIIRDTKTPMTYFSPAVIHDAANTLAAEDSFTLRYRIVVHAGRLGSKQLQQLCSQFDEASLQLNK